jgi:hypothetical protein
MSQSDHLVSCRKVNAGITDGSEIRKARTSVGDAAVRMETHGLAVDVLRRRHMGEDPVEISAPCQILDIGKDLAPFVDAIPEIFEHCPRHVRVPDDAVLLAEQFRLGISGDLAEYVVGVGDAAGEVGFRDDEIVEEDFFRVLARRNNVRHAPGSDSDWTRLNRVRLFRGE